MWIAYLCVLASLPSLELIPSASGTSTSTIKEERHIQAEKGLLLQHETATLENRRFRSYGDPSNRQSRSKRALFQVGQALSFVSSGIGFLLEQFTEKKQNIEQVKATKVFTDKLQMNLTARLEGIEAEIIRNRILTSYGDVEEGIRQAIDAFELYKQNEDGLSNTTKYRRNAFFSKAEELPKHLEKLMRGFLGDNTGLLQLDLLQHTYDIIGCQGRRFRNSVEALANLIHSGVFVYLYYVNESDSTVTDLNDLPFVAQFDAVYKKLTKRVEEFLLRCRKLVDVTHDIRSATLEACARVVHEHYCPADVVQRAVHERLEAEYGDYDRWIVSAFPSKTIFKLSPRFRTVIFDEFRLVVTAFAIDRRIPALSLHPLVVDRLRFFRASYNVPHGDLTNVFGEDTPDRPFVPSSAKQMYADVRALLTGLSAINGTHLEVGVFLAETEECGGIGANNLTDKHPPVEIGGALIHPLGLFNPPSNNTTLDYSYQHNSKNNNYWLGSGVNCGYRKRIPPRVFDVLVIPVSAEESSARISVQSQTNEWRTWTDNEGYHLMRFHNQRDVYLSVKDDSDQEGAYIVVESEWRNNSRGQRWKFYNNQLVNGHGLCLTAWYNTRFGTGMPRNYHYLYQYNCTRQWEGQRWRRNGMQVVNDVYPNDPVNRLAYCLAITPGRYAVRSSCISYYSGWVSWSTYEDVADDVDGRSRETPKPIRNLKNGKYLSHYKRSHDKPWYFSETQSLLHTDRWMGELGQKWRFLNGHLKSEEYDDKCVAIDVGSLLRGGGVVRLTKCDAKEETQRLAYNNATKQIFGTKGIYCLGLNANNWHEIEFAKCAEKTDDASYQWDFY